MSRTLPAGLGSAVAWTSLLAAVSLAVPLRDFAAVFFEPLVIGHQDVFAMDLPLKRYLATALAAGHLALLDPLNVLGTSVVANPATGTLYPPNLLYLLLPPGRAYRCLFLLHYPLAGFGLALALRKLGATLRASVLTASLFLLSGLVWSMCTKIVELPALAWCGWSAYLLLCAWERRSPLLAAAGGVLGGVAFLAGDPLSVPLGAAFAAIGGGVFGSTVGGGRRARPWLNWGSLLVAHAAGAAVVCWPIFAQTQQVLPLTSRGLGMERDLAFNYSGHPLRLIEVLLPWLKGPMRAWLAAAGFTAAPTQVWYASLGCGLVFCLCTACGVARAPRRVGTLLAVAALTGLWLLSFGNHVPLGESLWTGVYPLSTLRYPEKFSRYAILLALPFTALGIDLLWHGLGRCRPVWLAALVGASLVLTFFENRLGLAGQLLYPEHPPVPAALAAVATGRAAENRPMRVQDCSQRLGAFPGATGAIVDTRQWFMPMVATASTFAPPLLKQVSCEWMLLPRFGAWLGLSHVLAPGLAAGDRSRLEADYGLSYLGSDPSRLVDLYQTAEGAPDVGIYTASYAVGEFLSRAELATRLQLRPFLAGPNVIGMTQGHVLVDPRFLLDTAGRLQIDPVFAVEPPAAACPTPWRTFRLTLGAFFDVIHFDEMFACPGLVSLPWGFQPGWRLKVNGEPQPLLRVNDVTLGFAVPQGRVQADLEFVPVGFFFDVLASGAAVLALLLLAAMQVLRRSAPRT